MSDNSMLTEIDFPMYAMASGVFSRAGENVAVCTSPGMAREIALRLNASDLCNEKDHDNERD